MNLTGMVDKRTLEKYEREAKEKSRETWYLSWALDTNQEGERLLLLEIDMLLTCPACEFGAWNLPVWYVCKFFSILLCTVVVILRPTEPVALAVGDTGNEKISLNPFPGKAQTGKGKGHPMTGYEGPEVE